MPKRAWVDLNKSHSANSALGLRSAGSQLSVTTRSLRARLEGEGGPGPGLMVFETRRSDMGAKDRFAAALFTRRKAELGTGYIRSGTALVT